MNNILVSGRRTGGRHRSACSSGNYEPQRMTRACVRRELRSRLRRRAPHGGAADPHGAPRRESAHTYAHTAHPRRGRPVWARGRVGERDHGPRDVVSVLNEIHHQNSIQINKIVHEHGIKHKVKKTSSVENVASGPGGRWAAPAHRPGRAPPMLT